MNIAIWGYYGFANVGDEAILACMLDELQRTRLGGNVTVYSGNPKNTQRSHRVQAVSGILPDRFMDRVIRSLGRGRSEYFRSLKAFKNADLIIVGGGGLFFDGPDQNV
ncbi:MAG: polysaccharide pyruvyl transferase family protein, partial [Candidatus Zixiibacteriota bacterium]